MTNRVITINTITITALGAMNVRMSIVGAIKLIQENVNVVGQLLTKQSKQFSVFH